MKLFVVTIIWVAAVYADVSELGYDYLPPAQEASEQTSVAGPQQNYIPPVSYEPAAAVQHPTAVQQDYIPPAASAPVPASVDSVPEDDGYSYDQPQPGQGYRYKTVRRVVYRHRA